MTPSNNIRFIHHFTIAEIGSLVTYRTDPDKGTLYSCLIGRVGIVRAIENRLWDQLLTVDFNFVLKSNDKKGNESIGPLWTISADNLAPLPTAWVPPAVIRRSTQVKADPMVVGSTPSAYYFATPPSVEVTRGQTPTTKARGAGVSKLRKARAF